MKNSILDKPRRAVQRRPEQAPPEVIRCWVEPVAVPKWVKEGWTLVLPQPPRRVATDPHLLLERVFEP